MHKFESHVLYAKKIIEVEWNLRDPPNATPPRNKALLREANG